MKRKLSAIAGFVLFLSYIACIALVINAIASVFAEPPSVSAPYIALCSALIASISFLQRIKFSAPPLNPRRWCTEWEPWRANAASLGQLTAAVGMSWASLLWLTDAANNTKGTELSTWETAMAFSIPTGLALPPAAFILATVLNIVAAVFRNHLQK